MKKHTFLFLLVLIFLMLTLMHGANAQKRYMVRVKLINGQETKGELLFARGDSLKLFDKHLGGQTLKVSEIRSIRIHRKGAVGQGAAIGAGVGVAVGALVGLASYAPPSCPPGSIFCIDFGPGASVAEGAALGIVAGAIVGALAGAGSKEIKINADRDQLHSFIMEFGVGVPSAILRKH